MNSLIHVCIRTRIYISAFRMSCFFIYIILIFIAVAIHGNHIIFRVMLAVVGYTSLIRHLKNSDRLEFDI